MKVKNIILLTSILVVAVLTMNVYPINENMVRPKNVLGTDLISCCNEPMTGFYRDGFCSTGVDDYGVHVICAIVSKDFLEYSKSMGNDLTQALDPPSSFQGLKPGDKWCLCASRWVEALREGHAPKVILEATHKKALEFVDLKTLRKYEFIQS